MLLNCFLSDVFEFGIIVNRKTTHTGNSISFFVTNKFQQRVGYVHHYFLVLLLFLVQTVFQRLREIVHAISQSGTLVAIVFEDDIQIAGRLIPIHLRLEFRNVDERLKALCHLTLSALDIFKCFWSAVFCTLLFKQIFRLFDG